MWESTRGLIVNMNGKEDYKLELWDTTDSTFPKAVGYYGYIGPFLPGGVFGLCIIRWPGYNTPRANSFNAFVNDANGGFNISEPLYLPEPDFVNILHFVPGGSWQPATFMFKTCTTRDMNQIICPLVVLYVSPLFNQTTGDLIAFSTSQFTATGLGEILMKMSQIVTGSQLAIIEKKTNTILGCK
jgi:hypothetical protein